MLFLIFDAVLHVHHFNLRAGKDEAYFFMIILYFLNVKS